MGSSSSGTIGFVSKEMIALLADLNGEIGASFCRGATSTELEEVEDTIRAELPIQLQEFWSLTNGQDLDSPGIFNGDFRFLSTYASSHVWQQKLELMASIDRRIEFGADEGIRPVLWSRSWIPFARAPAGCVLSLDLDPAIGGIPGQVVLSPQMQDWHFWLNDSLLEFLQQLVSDLHAGRFSEVVDGDDRWLEHNHSIVRKA